MDCILLLCRPFSVALQHIRPVNVSHPNMSSSLTLPVNESKVTNNALTQETQDFSDGLQDTIAVFEITMVSREPRSPKWRPHEVLSDKGFIMNSKGSNYYIMTVKPKDNSSLSTHDIVTSWVV